MNVKRKITYCFMLMAAITLLIPSGLAVDVTDTYTENFENDTAGSDPTETWYTFTDTAWATATTVVEDVYRSTNHSYEIDDTNGSSDYTYFNWTGKTYDYFELYFKIDNTTHERVCFAPLSTLGVIGADVTVFGMGSVEPYVQFSNYTSYGFDNYTISNDTWYCIRWDFNYTTYEVKASIYDNDSVLKTSGWLRSDPEVGYLNFTDSTGMYIYGVTGKDIQIWFDDFTLVNSYYRAPTISLGDNFAEMFMGFLIAIFTISIVVVLFKSFGKLFN